jgi:hypothetical protein
MSASFLTIVRLNVALAQALGTIDPSALSEEARRYLRFIEFLAVSPDAAKTGETRRRTRAHDGSGERGSIGLLPPGVAPIRYPAGAGTRRREALESRPADAARAWLLGAEHHVDPVVEWPAASGTGRPGVPTL